MSIFASALPIDTAIKNIYLKLFSMGIPDILRRSNLSVDKN